MILSGWAVSVRSQVMTVTLPKVPVCCQASKRTIPHSSRTSLCLLTSFMRNVHRCAVPTHIMCSQSIYIENLQNGVLLLIKEGIKVRELFNKPKGLATCTKLVCLFGPLCLTLRWIDEQQQKVASLFQIFCPFQLCHTDMRTDTRLSMCICIPEWVAEATNSVRIKNQWITSPSKK